MNIRALIADLVTAGTDPDLVGRVAEAFAMREPVLIKDEQAERRRAKDRERKQAKQIPQISADSAEQENEKEITPTPPKENKQISNEICNNYTREADFQQFWGVYPRREGSNPKEPARKSFFAAIRRGFRPEEIILGATAYRDFRADDDPKFTKQAVTWLNQRGWLDDYSGPRPRQRAGPNASPTRKASYSQVFQEIRDNHEPDSYSQDQWTDDDFGPGAIRAVG